MSFSFSATAGHSQSTAKPRLAGNEIHKVKLESCTKEEYQNKKDATSPYKVLKIRFSNDDGYYEHTFFEPTGKDFERQNSNYTDRKTGEEKVIVNPSNVESMMLLFKHIMDAFVPKIAQKIDKGEQQIGAPNWDGLRDLLIKIFSVADTESNIKLIKNKNGEGVFPGFFTSINKEKEAYIRNNMVGDKVTFSAYEVTRMKNEASAKPTDMTSYSQSGTESNDGSDSDLDFDFNVDDVGMEAGI